MKNQTKNQSQLGNSYFKVQEQLGLVRRELKVANERLEKSDFEHKMTAGKLHAAHNDLYQLNHKLKSARRDMWLAVAIVVIITILAITGVAL